MKKILILLTSGIITRNYLSNNNFEKLEKNYDVTYGFTNIPEEKLYKNNLNKKFSYINNKNSQNLTERLTSLYLWKNINKSLTFKYRYFRKLGLHAFFSKKQFFLIKVLRFLKFSIYTNKLWYLLLPFFASKILFKLSFNFFFNKIEVSKQLIENLEQNKYDLILIPSHYFEIETACIKKMRLSTKAKFLVLINNWDNLSSKGTYWHLPEYMGVWGKQAKEHAINIQGFRNEQINIIGSPIYDKYFEIRNEQIKSFFSFDYILFTGCNLPFDEITVLKKIDKLLNENNEFSKIKIVYRPHPFREKRDCFDNFYENQFKNIILDPQIKDIYYKKKSKGIENLSLDYYPSLIKNALFIIAPLSTMLLESLIFYKKVLILSHNDDFHYTTPHRNLKNFEHLKPIRKSNLVSFSYDKGDLLEKLKFVLNLKNINYKEYDALIDYILYFDQLDYKTRLLNFVKKVI